MTDHGCGQARSNTSSSQTSAQTPQNVHSPLPCLALKLGNPPSPTTKTPSGHPVMQSPQRVHDAASRGSSVHGGLITFTAWPLPRSVFRNPRREEMGLGAFTDSLKPAAQVGHIPSGKAKSPSRTHQQRPRPNRVSPQMWSIRMSEVQTSALLVCSHHPHTL